MNRATVERLAELLMDLPEGEREALLASLAVQRRPAQPAPRGPAPALPPARTEAVVTCQVEWV